MFSVFARLISGIHVLHSGGKVGSCRKRTEKVWINGYEKEANVIPERH